MEPYMWWLVIAAAFAIAEIASLGLITVWFVIGALAGFAVAFFGGPFWLQLIVFLGVSIACLLLLRPLALKYRERGKDFEATPIGGTAVVIEAIDGTQLKGRVETPDHMTWAALSASGELIEEGANVRIVDHESVKLIVERVL